MSNNENRTELPETTATGFNARTKEIRTPENRAEILRLFACGLRWEDVERATGINASSIRNWMEFDPTFQDDYLKAKARAADFHIDQIESLAEEAMVVRTFPLIWPEGARDAEGNDISGQPHPRAGEPLPAEKDKAQRIRAAMEGRKIALEKRAPKKYGNLLKIADADGEALKVFVPNFANAGILGPDGRPVDGGALPTVEPDWVEADRNVEGRNGVPKIGGEVVTAEQYRAAGMKNPYEFAVMSGADDQDDRNG